MICGHALRGTEQSRACLLMGPVGQVLRYLGIGLTVFALPTYILMHFGVPVWAAILALAWVWIVSDFFSGNDMG